MILCWDFGIMGQPLSRGLLAVQGTSVAEPRALSVAATLKVGS